jgi:CRISPR-associated protein Cmx8
MKTNAELLEFGGVPKHNLLLHFWRLVSWMGLPVRLKVEEGKVVRKTLGHAVAIPDVSDLRGFVRRYPDVTAGLSDRKGAFGPADAELALPEEAGLEYLRHLGRLAQSHAQRQETAYRVDGVEVFNLLREGNNTKILSFSRIPADGALADGYEAIRDGCKNSLFRSQRLLNLLRRQRWYSDFDRLFDTQPEELFFDPQFPAFSWDARRQFEAESNGW